MFKSALKLQFFTKVIQFNLSILTASLVMLIIFQSVNTLSQISVYTESRELKSPEAVLSIAFKNSVNLPNILNRISNIDGIGISSISSFVGVNDKKIPFEMVLEVPSRNKNYVQSEYHTKLQDYLKVLEVYKKERNSDNLDTDSLNNLTKNLSLNDVRQSKFKAFWNSSSVYSTSIVGNKDSLLKAQTKLNSLVEKSEIINLEFLNQEFVLMYTEIEKQIPSIEATSTSVNLNLEKISDILKNIDVIETTEIDKLESISKQNLLTIPREQAQSASNISTVDQNSTTSHIANLFKSVEVMAGGWDAGVRLDGWGVRVWASKDVLLSALAGGSWPARGWLYRTAVSVCYAFWWVVDKCIAVVSLITTGVIFWYSGWLINVTNNCGASGIAIRLNFDNGGLRVNCENK